MKVGEIWERTDDLKGDVKIIHIIWSDEDMDDRVFYEYMYGGGGTIFQGRSKFLEYYRKK